MRVYAPAGLFCLLFSACSGGDGEPDAAEMIADAGVDAGQPDSGLGGTPCGDATCTPDQYCHIDPTGACVPATGSSCAAGEEVCEKGGDGGCTTPRSRECRPLPAACATNAQCACMINQNLCPMSVLAMCRRPMGQGVTIECPFP